MSGAQSSSSSVHLAQTSQKFSTGSRLSIKTQRHQKSLKKRITQIPNLRNLWKIGGHKPEEQSKAEFLSRISTLFMSIRSAPPMISSSFPASTESAEMNQQFPTLPCLISLALASFFINTGLRSLSYSGSPVLRYSSGTSHSTSSGSGPGALPFSPSGQREAAPCGSS